MHCHSSNWNLLNPFLIKTQNRSLLRIKAGLKISDMDFDWEKIFFSFFQKESDLSDASHDLGHFQRVAATAKKIASLEESPVDLPVIIAAAYFHDIVCLPKNHPDVSQSSRLAAQKSREILEKFRFPTEKIASVCHAIEAHSFSANILPQTIEAKIIQDADRMEALGALGILRTFYVSGRLGTAPYHPSDLLGKEREIDDRSFALDHFFAKLFKLPALLQTNGGKTLAKERIEILNRFIRELILDLRQNDRGALLIIKTSTEAGKTNGLLFSHDDPFSQGRVLQPQQFVLDRLMEERKSFHFLPAFIDQLKSEIQP